MKSFKSVIVGKPVGIQLDAESKAHMEVEQRKLKDYITDKLSNIGTIEKVETRLNAYCYIVCYNTGISNSIREDIMKKFPSVTIECKDSRDYFYLQWHTREDCRVRVTMGNDSNVLLFKDIMYRKNRLSVRILYFVLFLIILAFIILVSGQLLAVIKPNKYAWMKVFQ